MPSNRGPSTARLSAEGRAAQDAQNETRHPDTTGNATLGVQESGTVAFLSERLLELEQQLVEQSWERLGAGAGDVELSRAALREINRWARLMYLKNPLIQRGVKVQALYVFGQGIQIRGRAAAVNDVVQAFLDDAKNQAELTSHQARLQKETELALFGGVFFVFFTDRASGRVRVRTIPEAEVDEIVCNPEDSKEPWYYRRSWLEQTIDLASGRSEPQQRTAYYPDWLYRPLQRAIQIGGQPVLWDSPVYHVRVGGLSDMRFGVSEVYAAIDWARAYKAFLEDWATLTRAYSRFAHKLTVPGGRANVAAAKTRLNTTLGVGAGESNPPPTVGSTFIGQPGVDLSPMRIGGANVSADDGRRLLLMVAAATGLPESFFGDVSVGTLATAKSLDRPTELQMLSRQTLWADVFKAILRYVILQAVVAPGGPLRGMGQVIDEDDGTPRIELFDPATGEELDATVDVAYPSILEHDIDALIRATISAATLDGKALAGTVDARTVSRLLLTALGVDDIDELLDEIYPRDGQGEHAGPPLPDGTGEQQTAEALREMRAAVDRFVTALRESDANSA